MTDPTYDPQCPLCTLKYGRKLLDWPGLIVVEALDGNLEAIPGAYLAIPAAHAANMADLPNDWCQWLTDAIRALGERYDITIDNVSTNLTPQGGRTIERHFHAFLLDRAVLGRTLRRPEAENELPDVGMLGLLIALAEAQYRLQAYRG